MENFKDSFKSIHAFIRDFNEQKCFDYIEAFKGVNCHKCGSSDYYRCASGFRCKKCTYRFNITSNTVFHHSKLSLSVWFFVIYQMANGKKNLSSAQISKNNGLTQKSAWHISMKIRDQLHQNHSKLSGIVEIDEAFFSRPDFVRKGKYMNRKKPVIGLFERGTKRVIIKSVPDRKQETIQALVSEYVETGSTIITDGFVSYKNLEGYTHQFVDHTSGEYVRGEIHTNGIENVWSFVKRNVKNPHHYISHKHLQSYLNEAAFKFNTIGLTDFERFNLILKNCIYG